MTYHRAKHTHKTKDRVTRTPLKTGGELKCSGKVSSSSSISGTDRVNLVTNPVISHEWGKDREVFTTKLMEHIRGNLWPRYSITVNQHLSSPPVFSGVLVTRSLVLCVCFVDHCLSFCTFSFGHYVVCSSSIYGFWLPIWYLQSLLAVLF
jgi:hypothetical protein